MKVLCAEDEKMCQTAIKGFCKKMDIEVDLADNGQEALEFCKKETAYTFILMDMYMPELNGLQAAESIRGLGHGSTYKIYLLTGAEEFSEEDAKKSGFDGLIRKPLSKKAFEDLVALFK